MTARMGLVGLLGRSEGVEQREALVTRHGLVVHCTRNSTGTVIRAASSPEAVAPPRPGTAARTRGSAATKGTPRPQPGDTPQ